MVDDRERSNQSITTLFVLALMMLPSCTKGIFDVLCFAFKILRGWFTMTRIFHPTHSTMDSFPPFLPFFSSYEQHRKFCSKEFRGHFKNLWRKKIIMKEWNFLRHNCTNGFTLGTIHSSSRKIIYNGEWCKTDCVIGLDFWFLNFFCSPSFSPSQT